MINHKIYPEQELFVVSVKEALTVDSLLSSVSQLRTDSQYSLMFKGVWDLRKSGSFSTLSDVQKFVSGLDSMTGHPPSKVAILADTPRITALVSLFENLVNHLYQSKTFTTVEAAGDWLGRDLTTYLPTSIEYSV